MKRGLLIFFVALFVGAVSFIAARKQCCCTIDEGTTTTHDGGTMLPELAWLRHELKLTDTQFEKVREMHLAYRPICEELCMKVAASRRKVQVLAKVGNNISPEVEAALQEQATVQVECQKAMLKHLHSTAAVMAPDQARQYLDAMLPQVIGPNTAYGSSSH
jgi:Spy/CpxP family protein refolding chaperone